jgi:hypothetical protein
MVPLMDQVDAFETTLASVLRYATEQVDVLVVYTGDYADPHGILSEIEAVVVPRSRGLSRLGMLALGAESATAPWVFWLSPGIELTEAALESALAQLDRRDLGLISPRIYAATDAGGGDSETGLAHAGCLASSVALTKNYHPQYLEELVGEQWQVATLRPQQRVMGPTGWAGLCRRSLLESWAHGRTMSLPEGYAELALGVSIQEQGWQHDWLDGGLIAGDAVTAEIERGYRWCGRSSNLVLTLVEQEQPQTWRSRAMWSGLRELGSGFLVPRLWPVAWSRFQSLGCLKVNGRRGSATSETLAGGNSPRRNQAALEADALAADNESSAAAASGSTSGRRWRAAA